MAKQKKPTSDASASKPTRGKKASRATAKAAKITSKSTKAQKAAVPVVTAIISKAEHNRQEKARKRAIEDEVLGTINWQWRAFALGIMNGKENYKAYAEAYDMNDVDRDERAYRVAATLSSRLLKNVKFREYWRELLEEQGFNDDFADTQMLRLIGDLDTPPAVRRATIRDYNELKGRIVKKSAFTDDKGISLFDPENTQFEIRVVRPEK